MNHFAQKLRKNQTDAEKMLWQHLRNRQILNCKFRRQHTIGPYVVDFICIEKGLIIEVDGSQHFDQQIYDRKRTTYFEGQGFSVLRFWNNDVLCRLESVLEKIWQTLNSLSPSP